MKVRTGRHLGRTLYLQHGEQPADDDLFLGIMDSASAAELVAATLNHAGVAPHLTPSQVARTPAHFEGLRPRKVVLDEIDQGWPHDRPSS